MQQGHQQHFSGKLKKSTTHLQFHFEYFGIAIKFHVSQKDLVVQHTINHSQCLPQVGLYFNLTA